MAGSSLCDNAEIVMGQSPPGDTCNTTGSGLPLLNGPTEYGPHHPIPVQFTKDSRKLAQKGDVLFCVRGSTTGRMNWSDREYAIGRGVAAIRHRTAPELQPFVRAVIEYGLPGLLAQATGSTFPNVSADQLAGLWWPPLGESEQRAIAHILGTLDDKIEMNRRMNETLEAMARVEFERMKDEGGGKTGKIEDLCTLSRETITPGEFPDETFDHYSIPAFDEGRLPKPETGESIKSNKLVVPANAAMISKLNPRIPRIWLPDLSTTSRSIASTEFLIAIPKPGISREWLYGLFASQAFLDVFTTMITGTSGSHQRVKPEYLLAMDMEIPPAEAIQQYTKAIAPLHKRIALNLQESRTLVALRDTLLPKLLSGEVRVPAIAQPMETQS